MLFFSSSASFLKNYAATTIGVLCSFQKDALIAYGTSMVNALLDLPSR